MAKYQSRRRRPDVHPAKPASGLLRPGQIKHRLTWYRWDWPDPVHRDLWTACTVSIYQPTYERPYVSVLISIANGGGKVLMRTASLAEAQRRVGIPQEAIERLHLAESRAIQVLADIRRDLQIVANSQSLAPGAQLVRTDTGEVVAEAERIIREST